MLTERLAISACVRTCRPQLGMHLVHRGADAGNLDSSAVRLVYAERTLSPAELTAATT